MNALVVKLSDEQIRTLEQAAEDRGTSVDRVVADLVDALLPSQEEADALDVEQDPLYRIQAHSSAAPSDLASNVDRYLYGAGKT